MLFRLSTLCLILLSCCAPPSFEPLSPAEGSQALGERGPFAVELLTRRLRVRTDESVQVDAFFPVGIDDAPLAVVVQGGAVSPERYHWLGEHLASRGLATIMPYHALNLALFESANASDAARVSKRLSAESGDVFSGRISQDPGLIIGHSLGGVVALSSWLDDPQSFSHVVALASIPNPGDDFSLRPRQDSARILSIVGELDGSIPPNEVIEGFDIVESGGTLSKVPVQQIVVEGMTHYQFTDDPTESELAKDGAPSAALDQARSAALFLVDAAALELSTKVARPDLFDDTDAWPETLREVTSTESEP